LKKVFAFDTYKMYLHVKLQKHFHLYTFQCIWSDVCCVYSWL